MSEIEEGIEDEVDDSQLEDSPASDELEDQDGIEDNVEDDDDDFEEEDEPQISERERMLQKRVEEQERVIRLFQETGGNNQQQQQVVPEYDPEDLATFGSVDEMVERKLGAVREQQRQSAVKGMVLQAEANYPDYNDKYKAGLEYVMSTSDPASMEKMIMGSDNPAQLMYEIGTMASGSKSPKKSNVAGRVKKNLAKPNTLNKAGGQKADTTKLFTSMTPQEKEDYIKRVKFK